MRSQQWKTYRTRFLVKAKQLSSNLTFTDHLGRQHCGRKGDYLVESNDGVVSITPRRIFEDIYVPMSYLERPRSEHVDHNLGSNHVDELSFKRVVVEPLEIERISSEKRRRRDTSRCVAHEEFARGSRKSPQSVRGGRTSTELILM